MDAVSKADDPSGLGETLHAAQAELAAVEQAARRENDPSAQLFHALRLSIDATAAAVAVLKRPEADSGVLASLTELKATLKEALAEGSRSRPELEPGVIRDIQERLANLGEKTGEAVGEKIKPELVASVTGGLKQQIALLAHVTAWRVVAISSAIPVLALIIGAGVGYWRGHVAGYEEAATTIEASGPVEKAVLAGQGIEGLQRWHQLMRDNDIVATMKQDCQGKSVQHQDGRTACNLWLWTTPNVVPTPKGYRVPFGRCPLSASALVGAPALSGRPCGPHRCSGSGPPPRGRRPRSGAARAPLRPLVPLAVSHRGGIGGLAMAWITYNQGPEPKSVAVSMAVASLVAVVISRAALFLSVRAKYWQIRIHFWV